LSSARQLYDVQVPNEQHIERGNKQDLDLEERIHGHKLILRKSLVENNHQRKSFINKRNYSKHPQQIEQLGHFHPNNWMRYHSLQWI
jgi:hypothetical protein